MSRRPAVILYVEHNRMLLQTVSDVLEFAGWYVKPCTSDGYAMAYVEGAEYFDLLLLLDHDFHGLSGLKLTERARRQPHRRETPIVLISLEDMRVARARTPSCESRTTSSTSSKPSGGCSTRAVKTPPNLDTRGP